MSDLDRVYDRLLDQFSDTPNWLRYYTVFTELTDELRQALISWHAHRYLETAEGHELDVCGIRIGLPRPIAWVEDGLFTWDSAVVGERWDEGVWSGTGGLQTSDLMSDDDYRPLLRAKAYANGAGSSLYDIATTIDRMFAIDYTIETYGAREIRITFNEPASEFQRYYIRELVPVQADTDLVLV